MSDVEKKRRSAMCAQSFAQRQHESGGGPLSLYARRDVAALQQRAVADSYARARAAVDAWLAGSAGR